MVVIFICAFGKLRIGSYSSIMASHAVEFLFVLLDFSLIGILTKVVRQYLVNKASSMVNRKHNIYESHFLVPLHAFSINGFVVEESVSDENI